MFQASNVVFQHKINKLSLQFGTVPKQNVNQQPREMNQNYFSLAFSENRNYFIAITRMMQSGHPQENLMIYGSKLKLYWTA